MRVTARLARQRAPRTNDEWPWESPCSMLLRICASPHGDRSHRHRGARDEHRRAMILRRLIERGYVGAKQLVETSEVGVQLGAQLLHPPFDDFVRRLRVGQGEAEAESLEPVVKAVEVMDIVLSGVTLHVGIVQDVLELLELSAEVAPLTYDGCGRRRVTRGVVPQRLLRVLELCLEAHDAG